MIQKLHKTGYPSIYKNGQNIIEKRYPKTKLVMNEEKGEKRNGGIIEKRSIYTNAHMEAIRVHMKKLVEQAKISYLT
ncbi:hypothetical protein MK805_09820 [Shimazuella sp. AN120528]|uniref:spore photoproduct lyase family protein n=1 Tax=Shimazuella soli TaxID=1892854 RepID=UPI001F0F3712|nr:hypothetical protein [Shimazuella soli]MCH5585266.1 hypothetical protein [Shimazuella soli]